MGGPTGGVGWVCAGHASPGTLGHSPLTQWNRARGAEPRALRCADHWRLRRMAYAVGGWEKVLLEVKTVDVFSYRLAMS